jgi:enoyl-CoA hydratase/carnithine racemase
MLLNPRLSADQAHAYGLVTAVYDTEEFDAQVIAIASETARGPARAMAIAKELLNQSAGMDRLEAHLDRELDELTRIADGDEFAEGLRAFLEKRPAVFSGAGGWRPGTGENTEGGESSDRPLASRLQPPAAR